MTSPTRTPVDVVVIGGGIGGLSAAVALTQQGLTVRLHEKADAFGEVGAGLQLAPNCTRILDHLGLLDEVLSLGVTPERMVGLDAQTGEELTHLDLGDVAERYGHPYVVIHRSDLHGTLLRAAERAGVELLTGSACVGYEQSGEGGRVTFADESSDEAPLVVAADGLHSGARRLVKEDEPVSSSYVAYRGAVPIEQVVANGILEKDVVVHLGPRCHFVQYPLRQGEMFNQVAVFESPKAVAGDEDWGTPDELDAAFEGLSEPVTAGLRHMWRDRWWRMFDREPLETFVAGRVVLLGDAAHPPLQYMAQGAIMAIEDGWVLAQHASRHRREDGSVDWEPVLAAYDAVRPEHCRRILQTGRVWGRLWHVDGLEREQRNEIFRRREIDDYSFIDWAWGPTALVPEDEPEMFRPIPLASVEVGGLTRG